MANSRKRSRPPMTTEFSSSQSSHSQERLSKQLKTPLFDPRNVIYISHDKLKPGEKELLESMIKSHGGTISATLSQATCIITAANGLSRAKQALPATFSLHETPIIKRKWVDDSIAAGSPLPIQDYMLNANSLSISRSSAILPQSARQPFLPGTPRARKTMHEPCPTLSQEELQSMYKEANLACQRWSPLVCINDGLVRQLAVIKRGRKLVDANNTSALSYSRAISGIKAYPWKLQKGKEYDIPGVSQKIRALINEYLDTGIISEAQRYTSSAQYQELDRLEQIYGVGAHTARKLHGQGLSVETVTSFDTKWLEDFAQKVPRQEVEEIGLLVAEYLEQVRPGCEYTLCGGYRRGKHESNDVDIIITHPEAGKENDLLEQLVEGLKRDDILVREISHSHTWTKGSTAAATKTDPLDKSLAVFMPPKRGSLVQCHRRVDLIVAPYKYYWTAIVGWTGSSQFERDIRRWAELKGLKFDSGGLVHRTTSEEYFAKSERHLFDLLGLPFIPPTYRNADQNS